MPLLLPTIEQIEDYLENVEDLIVTSLSAATPDLGQVSDAIHRLWQDVLRHSPQAVPASFKGLGAFEVPPPPPPPPPPSSVWENTANWVADHPWTTAGIGIGVVGAGLLVGYASPRIHRRTRVGTRKHAAAASTDRRQVIGEFNGDCIVLGGDSPLGHPLILDLEKKGYIVITSVSTPEAVDEIESKCHGYVRALVLDPTEPEMIPFFLRSLASAMSRRFPITSAGDPHAPPSAHIYVHSVVSLLTLPSPALTPPPAPLEHLNLRTTYADYLQATHVVPLQLLQALLPLLRASPARARDALANGLGKQSIVVCLPATDARVGLPFAAAQAMSAAATLRGVEVLRREIRAAAASGAGTEPADAMRNIKVTVIDVGVVGAAVGDATGEGLRTSVDEWTPAEQAAYGAAFGSILEADTGAPCAIRRQPSDVAAFVDTVVDVVSSGRKSAGGLAPAAARLGLGRLLEAVRGDRVVVGAGARTYAVAARLPVVLLDAVLNLPYLLISVRNALLPVAPHVVPAAPAPKAAPAPAPQQPPAPASEKTSEKAAEGTDSEHEHNLSDAGSEADVESNEGYGSGVGESWQTDEPNHAISTPPQAISLWLVPHEKDAEKIKTVMQHRPATPLHSPSSFPAFHPHITLATSPDAAALRAAIPPHQPAVPVRFKSVDIGDKYFMSVYVAAHSPAGSPLETLRAHLRAALGDAAVPPLAHLSLYYIDDADREQRRLTVEELLRQLRVRGRWAGDSVVGSDSTVVLDCYADRLANEEGGLDDNFHHLLDRVEGVEIWLITCDGPVEGWEVMEKFSLVQ
ncbi:hypothetical protein BD309DRAFT_988818 [Dichomitus squalens]|uniref:Uncharacterized protein n=1 Tax=Dichomitus squalens TaxID=114155 RepID=A0A4Q9QC39_9APHY|nr:hypothetical protein BD309DRAFT_988818 [Dichomitus squalens]TBU65303.1 hypothetical protein BD310DRAFT_863834 [Dichomitus squalens]